MTILYCVMIPLQSLVYLGSQPPPHPKLTLPFSEVSVGVSDFCFAFALVMEIKAFAASYAHFLKCCERLVGSRAPALH